MNASPVSEKSAGVPRIALSRKEAAEAIGVHPATFDRMRKRVHLPASRALGRPRYLVVDIEAALRKETLEPVA